MLPPNTPKGRELRARAAAKRTRRLPGIVVALLLVAAVAALALLVGCAAAPSSGEPVVERLDDRTAVTVVTLPAPLLYARTGAGTALVPASDIAIGPVEVNRMGERSYLLWTSLVGYDGPPLRLRLVATQLVVEPTPLVAPRLPFTLSPYRSSGAGAGDQYYAISRADLKRLEGRADLAVEIAASDGGWVRFEPWEPTAAALDAFIARQLSSAVASR